MLKYTVGHILTKNLAHVYQVNLLNDMKNKNIHIHNLKIITINKILINKISNLRCKKLSTYKHKSNLR